MLTIADTKRPLLRGAVALAAALFVLPSATARGAERCPGATDAPTSAETAEAAGDAVTCLVNVERSSRGLPALRKDADLARAARRHAADMVRRTYFSHVTPAGTTLGDRIRAAGYGRPGNGWRVGEALGWGTGARATPAALVQAWLASPPHRRILLEDSYREVGLGVVRGAPTRTGGQRPGATYALEAGVVRPA